MSTPATSLVKEDDEKYIIRIRKRDETAADDDSSTQETDTSADQEVASTAGASRERDETGGDSLPVSPLAIQMQEGIKSGTVLVRSHAHFEILDSQIRQEILGSATASVGEDGTFLGALPTRKKGERHRSLVKPLEEFLDSILRIPAAVRSDAMATFLTAVDTPHPDDEGREQHMYHDYLLPCNNMHEDDSPLVPEFHTIPRLGPFTTSVKTLPPGWWVVWQFHVESGITASVSHGGQVEFSVFVDQPSEEDHGEEEKAIKGDSDLSSEWNLDSSFSSESPRWRELVHREVCFPSSEQPFTGSYRFSPGVAEPASVTFQFTNVGSLSILGGGSRVQLQCAAVPHEAFRAACEAAREQNDADARRHRAPLLYAILYSTEQEKQEGGVHLSVEPFLEQPQLPAVESQTTDDSPEPEPSHDGMSGLIAEKDEQLKTLRTEVAKLNKDRDYIRGELGRITKLADDGKRKLQLMVSEKRVWSVAREEIQTELSRLSAELAVERKEKNDLTIELETAKREVQQLRGEVKFLECSAPTEEDENRQKEIVENAQSAVNDMRSTVAELETSMESMKSKNAKLEATVEKQKKVNKERLLRARAEVDESKMYQRVLEGKVRHLEQELRRTKDGQSARKKGTKKGSAKAPPLRATPDRKLDPKVASFEHPNERLNKQLNSLRDRHAKLVDLLKQDPNNVQNMELIGKIEKAIHDIVANAVKTKSAQVSSP